MNLINKVYNEYNIFFKLFLGGQLKKLIPNIQIII